MDLNKLTKKDLIFKCKELNIKGYSTKNKFDIIKLIEKYTDNLIKSNDEYLVDMNNNQLLDIKTNTTCTSTDQSINKNSFKLKLPNMVNQQYVHDTYKFIDLFCGIGGFHQALTKLNYECVFACDIDNKCRQTYEINYGIKPMSDIKTITVSSIPSFDILCAGFPCQPFSKAGFQKGFNDRRGNLFYYICDIVEYHKPKFLLLENVSNLATHDDGNTWKTIYQLIDELGYYTYIDPIIINVLHFNIPQNRERMIIMCKRKDLGELPVRPNIPKNPKKFLTSNIIDYIDSNSNEYEINEKLKDVELIWEQFIKIIISNNIDMPKYPIWTDWWDNIISDNITFYEKYKNWIDKNRQFYLKYKPLFQEWLETSRENKNWLGSVRKLEWQAGDVLPTDSIKNTLWTSRGSGIRIKRLNYIPTLVAMNMTPIYGPESRTLSPRELLRLQSFPDTFIYDKTSIHKQIGNAVNVTMIEKSIKFLINGDKLFE